MSSTASNLDAFLAEAPWIRRLAESLASSADADDLVQATYERLLTHPPADRRSPRGWLGAVLRNVHRMRGRGESRRRSREQRSSGADPLPSAEVLTARAEALSRVCDAVAELEEPFRQTVLLHYYEEIPLAEIARQEGFPPATVRSRLRTGLQRLRARLDADYSGERAAWAAMFLPIHGAKVSATGAGASVSATTGAAVLAGFAGALVASAVVVTGVPQRKPAATKRSAVSAGAIADSPERAVQVRDPKPSEDNVPEPPSSKLLTREAHAETLDAIHRARVVRLRDAGLPEDVVEDSAKDAKLLSDIETMMMIESAAELATSCSEAASPQVASSYVVVLDFVGEPDVGTQSQRLSFEIDEDGGIMTSRVSEADE